MRGYRKIPFAQKCPELEVIVSGSIIYKFHREISLPRGERWTKADFECSSERDCGIAHADCPVFIGAPGII
jgi:hypothetical protein